MKLLLLAALSSVLVSLAPVAWAQKAKPSDKRERLQPLLDVALRDTSIAKGSGNLWVMTGTLPGSDNSFQNNEGIALWTSADGKEWKSLGTVWSIDKDATQPQSAWQKQQRINPDNPEGALVRGITSPEIVFAKETYWITYSMNGQGTGLLKSTTGKPEGPYTDLGQITEDGTDASLFIDDDGTGYWVVGQGFIGKLKPDFTALDEPLKLLPVAHFPPLPLFGSKKNYDPHAPRTLGQAGAHLFKTGGKYYLTAAMIRDRIGVGCYDTFVCVADNVMGPYSSPLLMIPHGGQTTVFMGPGDKLMATFSGRDSRAVFRDKPAAVPIALTLDSMYNTQRDRKPLPRILPGIVTEFGPWAEMKPALPLLIRDLQFIFAPDGFAYLTGSGIDESYLGKIMVLRSKNMKDWEPVDVQFDPMTIPDFTEADRIARFDPNKKKRGLDGQFMDSEIHYAGGTFHIVTSLYSAKRADGSPSTGGPMWLRSTTGKAEGPYEYVAKSMAQASMFIDDDGKCYSFANGRLSEWDPKGNVWASKTINLGTTVGTPISKGDVGANITKILGKYVIFGTGWCGGMLGENIRVDGTYDKVYWQADKIEGPYEMPRRVYPLPHAGHSCPVQKGPDGRWYGLLFGNDSTGPWWTMPGVLVYDVGLDPDGTVRITLKDELP